MSEPDAARIAAAIPARPGSGIALPLAGAVLSGLGLMQIARLSGLGGERADWLAASGLFLLACIPVVRGLLWLYPHPRLGACNVVTLLRLALSCALLAPLLAGGGRAYPVPATALLILFLDGVDGWIARRSGLVSDFGARFDMETDALFALLLALLVLDSGVAGPEVLALGLMRYGFVMAGLVWPWLAGPLPSSPRRKWICVVQLSVLIALLVPLVPAGAGLLVLPAVGLLAWSFGVDILWLSRHRA